MLQKKSGILQILRSICFPCAFTLGLIAFIASCGGGGGGGGGTTPANSGELDTAGFNSPFGFVAHNNAAGGDGNDFGRSVAVDSSGKVLVAGDSISSAGNFDMVVWRYNSDGTLDTTGFNPPNGYIRHDGAAGGSFSDFGFSIVVDSNGKILVAGSSGNGADNDMVIWRYNSDGTLDTSGFNSPNGFVVHDNAAGGGAASDSGNSIIVDSNGKILVAGSSEVFGGQEDMVIWRYNSDGTLDTAGFNSPNGFVVHNNAAGGLDVNDEGYSITVDSNGKILVTGSSETAFGADFRDMVIWRYNSDGTLDTTFTNGSTSGYVVHVNAAGGADGNDIGNSIALDSNGKILVAGSSKNATDNDMVIWRYNGDGTLDTTFTNGSTSGYIIYDNAAGGGVANDGGNSIIVDSNGKILVSGSSTNALGNVDMAIWRYNSDGTLDTAGFNSPDGYSVHDNAAGGNGADNGLSIALDSNELILITGYSANLNNHDMAIWRYYP